MTRDDTEARWGTTLTEITSSVHVGQEYARIKAALSDGLGRTEYGYLVAYSDRAMELVTAAVELRAATRIPAAAIRVELDIELAQFRADVRQGLPRSASNTQVDDAVMVRYPDVWRRVQARRARLDEADQLVDELVETCRERQRTIRSMLRRD